MNQSELSPIDARKFAPRIDFGAVSQTLGSLASLIVLSLILWSRQPVFMSSENWLNILRQASFNAILGVGMTFVILTAGVDLSVGAIVAVSSVVGGLLMLDHGWNMWLAVPAMVLIGGLCGLANGLIVTWGRIPPFIVTLHSISGARATIGEFLRRLFSPRSFL